MTRPPEVSTSIRKIAKAISVEGIAKTGQNQEDGYAFRTIDDIVAKLSPLLDEHNLIILPIELERERVERRTTSSMALFYTTVKVQYDITSTIDDSTKSITVSGEGMDTGDKSTAKAFTAAYKTAVTQAFSIATKNATDADQNSHTTAASMPAEDRTRHERAILAAIDAKTVKSAHSLATAAAVRLGDDEARKAFNEAKKTRTAQLDEQKTAAKNPTASKESSKPEEVAA